MSKDLDARAAFKQQMLGIKKPAAQPKVVQKPEVAQPRQESQSRFTNQQPPAQVVNQMMNQVSDDDGDYQDYQEDELMDSSIGGSGAAMPQPRMGQDQAKKAMQQQPNSTQFQGALEESNDSLAQQMHDQQFQQQLQYQQQQYLQQQQQQQQQYQQQQQQQYQQQQQAQKPSTAAAQKQPEAKQQAAAGPAESQPVAKAEADANKAQKDEQSAAKADPKEPEKQGPAAVNQKQAPAPAKDQKDAQQPAAAPEEAKGAKDAGVAQDPKAGKEQKAADAKADASKQAAGPKANAQDAKAGGAAPKADEAVKDAKDASKDVLDDAADILEKHDLQEKDGKQPKDPIDKAKQAEQKKKVSFGDEKAPAPKEQIRSDPKPPQHSLGPPVQIPAGDANKHSLPPKVQAKRLQKWLNNMRLFKLFNNDTLPQPKHNATKLYSIQLSNLTPAINMPQNYRGEQYLADLQVSCTLCCPQVGLFGRTAILKSGEPKAANDIKLDEWIVFHSDLDLSQTFVICEIIIQIYEKVKKNENEEIRLVDNIGLGIIAVQLVKDANGTPAGETTCIVKFASPRSFVFLDDSMTIEKKLKDMKDTQVSKDNKSAYKISADVKELDTKHRNFKQFLLFVQLNTLVCQHDRIPGFDKDKLPKKMTDKFIEDLQFNSVSEKWVHGVSFTSVDNSSTIDVDNIDLIDNLFDKWLQKYVANSGYKASVAQRMLTITSSNSCSLASASQATLALKVRQDNKGYFRVQCDDTTISPLKISNLAANALTCLVFRIVYKVKYVPEEGSKSAAVMSSKVFTREFVLGRKPFFLNFSEFSGYVQDMEVELELDQCRELSIINDLLWDANNEGEQGTDLFIKIRFRLSNDKNLKSESEMKKEQEEFIKNEENRHIKDKLIKGKQGGQPDEALMQEYVQLSVQNKRLHAQVAELEQQMESEVKKAKQDAMQKVKAEKGKDAEKKAEEKKDAAKKEEEKKEEAKAAEDKPPAAKVEPLQQIQPSAKVQEHSRMLDNLLGKENKDVRRLIELLQKLLEQTKEDQEQQHALITRLQTSIQKMIDQDPLVSVTLFGASGQFQASQFSNFREADKAKLLSYSAKDLGLQQMMSSLDVSKFRPSIDTELNTPYKASTISMKFVAFKTLSQVNSSILMPQRLYFTTKFYTFRERKTAQVLLRLPKAEAKDLDAQKKLHMDSAEMSTTKPCYSLLSDKLYFLMKYDGSKTHPDQQQKMWGKLANKIDDNDNEEQSNGLQMSFDFDPNSFSQSIQQFGANQQAELQGHQTNEDHQHELFSRYLFERALTIDLWNGESMMHFGSVRIPLYLLMRQGEAQRNIGQEFDVIEAERAEKVGGLQLVVTNIGRSIGSQGKASPKKQVSYGLGLSKNKKIVPSNPIPFETLEVKMQKEEDFKNRHLELQMNQEEKQRLRVQRLKKMNLVHDFKRVSDKIASGEATFWEKNEQLKQIELIREKTKAELLQKMSSQIRISDQKTIEVTSGEPYLFEIETSNPFDSKQRFRVLIDDEDFNNDYILEHELKLVDNSQDEWMHWYNKQKCSKPDDSAFVRGAQQELSLESGQSCNLLFKFQSFREPIVDSKRQEEDLYDADAQNELRPREIKIQIVGSNQRPIQQLAINIQPKAMICDQVFRYYEPQTMTAECKIPNFLKQKGIGDIIPIDGCVTVCSNRNIRIEQHRQDDALSAVIKNGNSMSVQKGFIFVYQNQFRDLLLGACKIEISALRLIQLKANAGEEYDYDLRVFNPPAKDETVRQRTVELFSTDPQIVYAPKDKQRNRYFLKDLKELRNAPQSLPVFIKSNKIGKSRTRVVCVDINSKEAIEQFLVQVDAVNDGGGSDGEAELDISRMSLIADADRVQNIPCIIGKETEVEVKVRNPHPHATLSIRLQSQNSHQVRPREPVIHLGPNDTRRARFTVAAPKTADSYRVDVALTSAQGASGNIRFMIQPRKN